MSKAIVVRSLQSLAGVRLAVGVAQGVALCLLLRAAETGGWPASEALIFAPLLLVACFVPLIVIFGLGNMRDRTLIAWAIAAAVLVAGVALHDASRAADVDGWSFWHFLAGGQDLRIWPSRTLVIFTSVALFIAQSLVVAGDGDHAAIAAYPLYFDAAWKHAAEAVFAAMSVGLLWLLLSLAAGLFKLMGIASLSELTQARWFALPMTTLTLAGAVHVADMSADVLRSMRRRWLPLLSWLLPLTLLFAAGLLAILPFAGLTPWSTHFTTVLLLATAAALILLINATYHDGLPEHEPPRVLRHAASVAALMLTPLVAIAGYGLTLRVAQHGWTTDRIIAAASIVIAACYALGYAVAAIRGGAWLRQIAPCNVAAAFLVLAVLFALSTPIADPARLSVLGQLARLDSGAVPAEEFDFAYLRFEGARYGTAALERLRARNHGANAVTIRRRAVEALAMTPGERPPLVALNSAGLAAHLKVFPRGHKLPASFLQQDWSRFKSWELPHCLADRSAECDAFLVDLNGNGQDEVVIDDHTQMIVMTADAKGAWHRVGHLGGPSECGKIRQALRAGKFEAEAPQWSDLKVGETRLALISPAAIGDCP